MPWGYFSRACKRWLGQMGDGQGWLRLLWCKKQESKEEGSIILIIPRIIPDILFF